MLASHSVGIASWRSQPSKQIANYHDRVREAGLEPVALRDPALGLAGCLGLVLTGGIDIHPSLYGEEMHPRTRDCEPERDAFEAGVLQEALEKDVPILAICRGQQLLNVRLGGSLLQHIEDWSHSPLRDESRTSARHQVRVSGVLRDILGAETVEVNSRHHQAVTPERLAAGLEPLAMSPDGLIEGLNMPSRRWVIGVQWHPERLEPQIPGFNDQSRRLFAAFAAACESVDVSTASGLKQAIP